jgi:hypothetical protein
MKKALEAGIEFCNKNINYNPDDNRDNTVWEDYLRSYIAIHHVLKAMLKALDDEPEKPESNESEQKIDFKYLEKNIFNLCCRYSLQHDMNDDEILGDFSFKLAKSIKDYFEHDKEPNKPAIDPEIKRVYEKFMRPEGHGLSLHKAHNLLWKCIKAHCEGG